MTKARPALIKAAQNYVDLHRHAAVQAALLSHPDLALKAMAAHIIAGSPLWSVKADPRRAENKEIAASVESSAGYQAMIAERKPFSTFWESVTMTGTPSPDAILAKDPALPRCSRS